MNMIKKKTKKRKLSFDIISIFPEVFGAYFKESLFRRAIAGGLIDVRLHNLRDFVRDKHKKVDDKPFGGGPGMVMKIEPIFRAVSKIRGEEDKGKSRVVLFSTRGKKLDAKAARRLVKYDQLILICGRYEGVDERVAQFVADEEVSIGDYILSGGELPAMIFAEVVARFLPGFLGRFESLEEIKGSYPVYTQPAVFRPRKSKRVWRVPPVLLSGNHRKISEWRNQTFS